MAKWAIHENIVLNFSYRLQTSYDIFFFHTLFSYFFSSSDNSLYLFFALSLLIILSHFHNNPLLCLKSLLCFFDNKLFHSYFIL